MRNILTVMLVMLFVGCTPSYASQLDDKGCKAVQKATRHIVLEYRDGKNQFDVFRRLNQEPMEYWNSSESAKLYTQSIVLDLKRNVQKGFRNQEILDVVKAACTKQLGETI